MIQVTVAHLAIDRSTNTPIVVLMLPILIGVAVRTGGSPSGSLLSMGFASILGGLLHALVQGLLLPAYIRNNPWYADKMKGPHSKLRLQFLGMGVTIGAVFGALMGGVAWGLQRL